MRRLVIAVCVLLVLAVGADRLAWAVAERVLASRIQSAEQLSVRPDVSISGFPFLTQVLTGRYSAVDAELEDLTVDRGVTVDHARVRLTGLRVPLSSLLDQSLDSVPVQTATATGNVSYSALDAAAKAKIPGNDLTVNFRPGAAGASNRIGLTGRYASGAVDLTFTGQATVDVDGGQLVVGIVPDSLGLPALVRDQVAELLGTRYRVPALPFGLRVSRVASGPGGVSITATGSNLVLGADSLS